MSRRVYNFCSGPAALPVEVLEQAREELTDWHGRGLSVMEMSHRSDDFVGIIRQAESDLRDLLGIPDEYAVLFLQGGASLQFAMVPLNLGRLGLIADYIDTGSWSAKAIEEASRTLRVNVAATALPNGYTHVPGQRTWSLSPAPAYIHVTPNETIGGLEYLWTPSTGKTPLVADMSSTLLSRPLDVSRFGLIYAGAQKNLGPSGLTVVIIRKNLLGHALPQTPSMLNYKLVADNGSLYNTPPTFAVYLAGLVFQWIKRQGGLEALGQVNQQKAAKLYRYIDASGFYKNPIMADSRSWMNIPFRLRDESLDKAFLAQAEVAGLVNLQGHRSTGGMRASLYNAMPEAGVDRLIEFMDDFAKKAE
jgi:phosphoserine aminotransferase